MVDFLKEGNIVHKIICPFSLSLGQEQKFLDIHKYLENAFFVCDSVTNTLSAHTMNPIRLTAANQACAACVFFAI